MEETSIEEASIEHFVKYLFMEKRSKRKRKASFDFDKPIKIIIMMSRDSIFEKFLKIVKVRFMLMKLRNNEIRKSFLWY